MMVALNKSLFPGLPGLQCFMLKIRGSKDGTKFYDEMQGELEYGAKNMGI